MTSAAKTTDRSRGFTLIEVVIVLVIAAVVVSGALTLVVRSSVEPQLKDASGEIELLAKRARMSAILKQTPYALEIREGVVRMMPLAAAGQDEKRTAGGHRIGGEPVSNPEGNYQEYQLKHGMKISVRRWNSEEWFTTLKDVVHVWRFDPNGLCEPLTIRLNLEKSWSEDTYHPLTATIRDTQMEVK
jgi:type II secretion system protein H